MTKPPEMITRLMYQLAHTQQEELDCDEVFVFMDEYAEALARGEDPGALHPKVKQHLELCRCCNEELHALLQVLEADQVIT